MPFVHDETNIEWPEDGSEMSPPHASQFVYMTAAEYRGEPTAAREFARFSIVPFSASAELESPISAEAMQPVKVEPRGILHRLFGWGRSGRNQQREREKVEDSIRRQILEQRRITQQLFSVMIPALRSLGVRRAYCRYDGGNDEGFSWLDRYETQGGERIDTDDLVKRLYEMGIHDKLYAGGFKDHMHGTSTNEKMSDVEMFACGWLIEDWAGVLLGSYGTGEYSMYGAFMVDLDECSVTDDPNARPIVQNIEIAE
jgi:hypothetical protein